MAEGWARRLRAARLGTAGGSRDDSVDGPPRRLMVLVNPNSGPGNALTVYRSQVLLSLLAEQD